MEQTNCFNIIHQLFLAYFYPMATNAPVASEVKKLDFKTLLECHAYVSYLKTEKKLKKVKPFLVEGTSSEFEDLVFDVSWDNAKLKFDNCEWNLKRDQMPTGRPIIGTCRYEGGASDMEVTHEGKGKTTVNFSMTWTKGNTFGLGLNSPVSLPGEAKELFGELAGVNINSDSFQTSKDQEWAFSVKVMVQKDHPITVDTIVNEETYLGKVSCTASLSGRVSVQIFKKKNHKPLMTITDLVVDVWNKMKKELEKIKSDPKSITMKNSVVNRLEAFINLPEQDKSKLKWDVSGDVLFTKGINSTVKVDEPKAKA